MSFPTQGDSADHDDEVPDQDQPQQSLQQGQQEQSPQTQSTLPTSIVRAGLHLPAQAVPSSSSTDYPAQPTSQAGATSSSPVSVVHSGLHLPALASYTSTSQTPLDPFAQPYGYAYNDTHPQLGLSVAAILPDAHTGQDAGLQGQLPYQQPQVDPNTQPALDSRPTLVPQPVARRPKHEKKFDCPLDGTLHASQSNLRTHLREKHTDHRPWSCSLCLAEGKITSFPRQASCSRHVELSHAPQQGHASDYVITDHSLADMTALELVAAARGVPFIPQQEQQDSLFAAPFPAAVQQTLDHMQPPGMPPPNTAVHCTDCIQLQPDEDTMLHHRHLEHDVDPDPFCPCTLCTAAYSRLSEDQNAWLDSRFYTAEWRWRPREELDEDADVASQHSEYEADLPPWKP